MNDLWTSPKYQEVIIKKTRFPKLAMDIVSTVTYCTKTVHAPNTWNYVLEWTQSLYCATCRGISKSETPVSKKGVPVIRGFKQKNPDVCWHSGGVKTSFVIVVCSDMAWALLKIQVFIGRQGIALCILFRLWSSQYNPLDPLDMVLGICKLCALQ